MAIVLTEPEVRVLGSLVEKEITTPEYYPLSLNALTTACNQKTNREPVTSYNDCTVAEALDSLRNKGLAIWVAAREARVPKYDNYFADTYRLSPQEVAVMCVLMLRGPQTAGEIRIRSERLYSFGELADVEATLDGLASREEGALVVKLPRQPGRKEFRYAHLLSGESAIDTSYSEAQSGDSSEGPCAEIERIQALEADLASLREEMQNLQQQFTDFKKQFE